MGSWTMSLSYLDTLYYELLTEAFGWIQGHKEPEDTKVG